MRDSKYKKMGNKGTPDKFLEAFEKVAGRNGYWAGQVYDKVTVLMDAAIKAFNEGQHENVQTALLNAKTVTLGSLFDEDFRPYIVATTLNKISANGSDKLAVVNIALEKIPEGDREEVLSNALDYAIRKNIGGKDFYVLLLEAGADANADINGPGSLLVTALSSQSAVSVMEAVIRLLSEKGASFDDAIATMRGRSFSANDVDSMRLFQEKITGIIPAAEKASAVTGEPVTQEVLLKVLETMQGMQEQIVELRRELAERLPPPAQPAAERTLKLSIPAVDKNGAGEHSNPL